VIINSIESLELIVSEKKVMDDGLKISLSIQLIFEGPKKNRRFQLDE